jgi:hypothetical protein
MKIKANTHKNTLLQFAQGSSRTNQKLQESIFSPTLIHIICNLLRL